MIRLSTTAAVAIVLASRVIALADQDGVTATLNLEANRCEISITRHSSMVDYRKAQADCRLTRYPTVYLVRGTGTPPLACAAYLFSFLY